MVLVELIPIPFPVLVARLFTELERKQAAFDLPAKRFFTGEGMPDLSISVHGHRVATPFGPAAGPHTQMAQNIVLAWLAGGRVIELKTVQIKDRLTIPRPCIDMQTIGFNVEWSQELTLEQSLEEYVKAAMLIEMLKAEGLAPGCGDTVFDMSVGYDLAGIRSPRVRAFMDGLMDARTVVEHLRAQIPPAFARFRDLVYPTCVSDTLTLSTFHGCPPEEIEGIAGHLLRDVGLHVVVKLNPTLLGRDELNTILHDRLGYTDLVVPDAAFAKDATWDQVQGFVGRLGDVADSVGRSFGVKFTNTLLVRNHKTFFPETEKEMYMSGAPLHVLAVSLVRRFRRAFGDRFPISFSAGIDAANFADAVALGLKPVSVCTDLLKTGGYGRGPRYLEALAKRMRAGGAADIDDFVVKTSGQAGTVSDARLRNTETYAARVLAEPRYAAGQNRKPPKKAGTALALFDCQTCDKCIPVCPNDANFRLAIPPGELAIERLVASPGGWTPEPAGSIQLVRPWQIANFADACNECGNCDVICPEDGGPYLEKPRFFGNIEAWAATPERDGFAFEKVADGVRMLGRFDGETVILEDAPDGRIRYVGEDFDITFHPDAPAGTVEGSASVPVDLTWARIMLRLRDAVLSGDSVTYIGIALSLPLP